MKLAMTALAVDGETLIAAAPLIPTKKMSKARLPRPGTFMEPSRAFVPHEDRMKALLGSSSIPTALAVLA